MSIEGQKLVRPYAFLFDGSLDGLPDPQLPFFTAALLAALSEADSQGRTNAQLRVGLPSLTAFAEQTSAVRGFKNGSGRTVSHNNNVYRYVVWEWLDSINQGWSSVDQEHGQELFRLHTCECIAISAISNDVRDALDAALRPVLGYVGGFLIDPGNPIHRGGFFDLLIPAAAIIKGAVVQDRSFEGEEHWALEGAAQFQPGGLVWQDFGWLALEGPKGLTRFSASERGAKAAANLAKKQERSLEGRVLEAIENAFLMNNDKKTFEFESPKESRDVLQAIMPEGKFTRYLFDREHKEGGSKAAFFIDELGIEPDDWRYLAAQFYYGLLVATPNAVKLNEWETGYGARFDVQMRVRSRSGNKMVVVTGWNMNPGKLPSLSTAFPGDRKAEAVDTDDPPILLPGKRKDADWKQLWNWSNSAGLCAGEEAVPTPMYIAGFKPISDGECGSAAVRIPDARTGLARWLARCGLGETDGYGGVVVFCPLATQSVDRAIAWARAVILILRLNGLSAEIEIYQS